MLCACAAETRDDGTKKVEFVEPPEGGEYFLIRVHFILFQIIQLKYMP